MQSGPSQHQHASSSQPDVIRLLTELVSGDVDFVVIGSVAALAYGVKLTPRDLDITIAPSDANFDRVENSLRRLAARSEGQKTFDLRQPDPAAAINWGQRFLTPIGEVDIQTVGREEFDALARRAVCAEADSLRFYLAHPDDILLSWQLWDHPRNWPRMEQLAALRQGLAGRPSPLQVGDRLSCVRKAPRSGSKRSRGRRRS